MAEAGFDYDTHWVSRRVAAGVAGIDSPLLTSVLKFSLPWDVLALAYTAFRWETLDPSFLLASALALLWVNAAPFLIWYYDKRVLPAFFDHLGEILPDEDVRHDLAERYSDFFASHRLSVSVLWAGIAVAIVFVSEPVLRSQGMVGPGAVFLWTTYAYALYVGAVLGHGFVGTVTTVLLVREVAAHDIEIDPLHPDGLGGLSTVGYCAIRTTLLSSTASLLLPLLFYFVAEGGSSAVIYGFTATYIAITLVSFVYPTVLVNHRAGEYRDEVLEDLRRRYRELEAEMAAAEEGELAELNRRLELQRVQQNYDNYESVSLYPLQVSILVRLAGSIVLPVLFMLVELYLPNLL